MALPKPVTVPADMMAWLVRAEGLGELHVVLAPTERWLPRAQREELEARYSKELTRLGPLDRRGRLDVDVLTWLTVLCRPTTEFYGWISTGETTRGVLAAAIGRQAMLAVRDGTSVWLSQVSSNGLAEALVAQTPDVPAARGSTVIVNRTELLATSGGRQRIPGEIGLRQASPQVRLVQRIIALDTTGCGELHVAVRDTVGRRRAAKHPLCYTDTVHGRFLNQVTGVDEIRIAPASRAGLVTRLAEAHRTLTREQRPL